MRQVTDFSERSILIMRRVSWSPDSQVDEENLTRFVAWFRSPTFPIIPASHSTIAADLTNVQSV